jgi:hypothetical protein
MTFLVRSGAAGQMAVALAGTLLSAVLEEFSRSSPLCVQRLKGFGSGCFGSGVSPRRSEPGRGASEDPSPSPLPTVVGRGRPASSLSRAGLLHPLPFRWERAGVRVPLAAGVRALALALILVGCAPASEPPNPWADFRPVPEVGRDTRSDLGEPTSRRAVALPNAASFRSNDYPPPAPPAEEPLADAPAFALADKRPAPPDAAFAAGNIDASGHWTGAIIYCQPGCVPCAMEIRDLRKAGWKVGVGSGSHFKIVELLTLPDFERRGVPSTPQTVFFIDGVEQPPRITGYGGTSAELAAIVNRHPMVKKAPRVVTALESGGCSCPAGGIFVGERTYQYAPLASATPFVTTYPGATGLLGCGAPAASAGYSVTYSAPLYAGAPGPPVCAQPGVTIAPATHSAQLSLFGFPLIGGSIGTTMTW